MTSVSSHAENLCQRLGIGPAVDPCWLCTGPDGGPTALRLIFMPSFHPFGCITLTGLQTDPHCEIRFEHELRQRPFPVLASHHEECFPWPRCTVREINSQALSAIAEVGVTHEMRWISIDGMPVACIYCDKGKVQVIEENCVYPAYNQLQILLLETALAVTQLPCIHNRLANCLKYQGIDKEKQPEPGQPGQKLIARLLVLGPDDDRNDLALSLHARNRRRRKGPCP